MSHPDRLEVAQLGLPDETRACLFDLDGVLTQTLPVHKKAWKETFDPLLDRAGQPPFSDDDYLRYVDGKRRADGVRDFLASRGLDYLEGTPEDPPESDTVAGIATRKNQLVLDVMEKQGVEVYDGSVTFLHLARDAGLAIGVVTASANGERALEMAGLADLVDVRIDGVVADREGLRGKPAPDTFLAAAEALGVEPARAAVFEDALSGVVAGRAGDFGLVVGVDRGGNGEALKEQGADVVVTDLTQLLDVR
jgi:beta-phosphoglucomutase family hydrolase